MTSNQLALQQTIFIMSPPRSGSTLLRNMLNEHPLLYSPPELYLLPFDSMKERANAFRGSSRYLKKGLIQAFSELLEVSYEQADQFCRSLEKSNTSTLEVYALLQSQLDGKILVDKSPLNLCDLTNLLVVMKYFQSPFFIHLHRHPYSAIDSELRQNANTHITKNKTFGKVRHNKQQIISEHIWLNSHMHAFQLENMVANKDFMRVCYEDTVLNPKKTMQAICKKLKIDFDPKMTKPYRKAKSVHKRLQGKKGTEYMKNFPMGDPGFYVHKDINPTLAHKWKNIALPRKVSKDVKQVAKLLGYTVPDMPQGYAYLVGKRYSKKRT